MALLDAMRAWNHKPSIQVYIDGHPVEALSVTVDHGFDVTSAACTVLLAAVPSWFTSHGLRKSLEIWLGFDGFTIPVFKGWVEDDARRYFPFDNQYQAVGHLKLAQYQYPNEVTYASQKDKAIKEDLLAKAGVPDYVVEGEDTTNLGTVQNVVLQEGTSTWELINQIDQLFGYKTFDGPDGVVRSMRISGVPGVGVAFAYVQGATAGNQLPILSISRPRTIRGIHNKVIVIGLPQDPLTPTATRQAVNPLVPTPPTYISYDYRSDLVETDAVASAVALRLMGELNGVLEEITFESVGNPWLSPGMTVSITAAQLGLASATNFYVQHVTHSFTESGFYDAVTATRIEGGVGYELGKPPVPVFTYRVTKEQYDVAGTPTTMYTVTCDGSASWDPDSPPDTLTFAWSNNKNADTGTAPTYATAFTQAQMDAATKPAITLVVNDADPTSPAGTLTQKILLTGQVVTRDLYVAADGRAEATKEGDVSWNIWTPGAGTVISVPPIVTGNYGYWGLSNGKLMQSSDHLVTAPTEIEDFGSQINCIYINRVNPNRVTVGLANGQVWLSLDADQGAASVWSMLYDGASAILAVWEDDRQQGQYRFTMGKQGLITYDNFASVAVQIEFADGDTARKIALSDFANYFCGTTAAGPAVKRDDGTPITFADGTVDVHTIAHHIRDDVLYAAVLAGDGTTLNTYRKAAGATAFTAKATYALGGQPNHMVHDPDNQLEFFLAADQGLYKTFTGFDSMVMVRDYTAAGIHGGQVGIGALALPPSVGNGSRVAVAGISGGVPRVALTHNVYAASPQWLDVGSGGGLPASATTVKLLRADPYSSFTTMCLVVDNVLYRNDNFKLNGAWVAKLSLATVNALLGKAHTSITISDLGFSIAEDGLLGVWILAQGDPGGDQKVYCHSHDLGDSWTAVVVTGNASGTSNMQLGQWDSSKVYLASSQTAYGRYNVHRSTDGGHSFTLMSSAGTSSIFHVLRLAYASNLDELELFRATNADGILRSIDGGSTWNAWSANNLTPTFAPENAQVAIAVSGALSIDKYISVNRAATWTQTAGSLATDEVAVLKVGIYYNCRTYVYTSVDWNTFVDRVGNLLTIFAGASPRVYTITVDSTS